MNSDAAQMRYSPCRVSQLQTFAKGTLLLFEPRHVVCQKSKGQGPIIAVLISVSVALSKTPAYALRPYGASVIVIDRRYISCVNTCLPGNSC